MKKGSIIFLQVIIVLFGLGILGLMLWEPHIEGRNVHATLFEVYFKDPFLAYAYVASTTFFVTLYQAFKILGHVENGTIFSQSAIKALRIIKYCAVAMIGFVVLGEVFIRMSSSDDRAGGVFMGLLIGFSSILIATIASVFERILQSVMVIKSENNLL